MNMEIALKKSMNIFKKLAKNKSRFLTQVLVSDIEMADTLLAWRMEMKKEGFKDTPYVNYKFYTESKTEVAALSYY